MKWKLRFFGHVMRRDGLERTIITGKVNCRRKRSRPTTFWLKDIAATGLSLFSAVHRVSRAMTTLYTSRKKLTRTISVGPVSERNVFTEESLIADASDEDNDVRSSVGDHRMLIRKQLSAPSQYNEHKNQKKRRSQQTGIGDFLHSLFSSKKRQDQVRVINKKNLHMSCPNLNSQDRFDEHLQLDKDEVNESRNSKRSSSAKYSMSSRNKSPESCACDTLKVPDIFVTSLTRSRSDDTCQSGISFTLKQKNKHLSTSNLHDTAVSRRLLLTSSESNSLSCSEENIARITPYLYVGRVEAANDQRLLCKLDIHSEMGMRKMFNAIDKDASGFLTMKELNKAIQDIALDVDTEKISNILIHKCQTAEKIDYEKFLDLYINQ
ncbi:kDa calcium-binding [Octopus vulgaris]|uniref:KDa calcium-binding n=1 Tax=Octopus vulgaris TaxID=6645 RepID=A0AA36AKB2_OCTVU|nr:kDa calcium-binding [Octopus vulgaris]